VWFTVRCALSRVDAGISFVSAMSDHSWRAGLEGALSLAIGALLLSRGGAAALTLLILMAAWCFARGVSELAFGVRLPEGARGRRGIVALGVVSQSEALHRSKGATNVVTAAFCAVTFT
jgi:uncharacterized membrane protein HdeD (DUF308 family)